jgi:hypothetical protein
MADDLRSVSSRVRQPPIEGVGRLPRRQSEHAQLVVPVLARLRIPPGAPYPPAPRRADGLPPLERMLPADRTREGYQSPRS